jgi:DNA-binding protein H-NS
VRNDAVDLGARDALSILFESFEFLARRILIGMLLEVLRKADACRALQDLWSRDADSLRAPAVHRRKLICKCNYLRLPVFDRTPGAEDIKSGLFPPNALFTLVSGYVTFIYGNVESPRRLRMSKKVNLDAMSIDEMWQLHEEISQILTVRLASEKRELEKRLAQLRYEKEMPSAELADGQSENVVGERRKYPRVFPKYQNPNEPSETWSGRGKQPRWLASALKTGRKIEEFVIGDAETNRSSSRQRRV